MQMTAAVRLIPPWDRIGLCVMLKWMGVCPVCPVNRLILFPFEARLNEQPGIVIFFCGKKEEGKETKEGRNKERS